MFEYRGYGYRTENVTLGGTLKQRSYGVVVPPAEVLSSLLPAAGNETTK